MELVKKMVLPFAMSVVACFFSTMVWADVLELKTGETYEGAYAGGTQSSIRFQVGGELKVIPTAGILAITFTSMGGGVAVAAPLAAATKSSVPAGTLLLVKLREDVTTQNKKAGAKFSAVLEGNLMAGAIEIAPAGASVYGIVLKSERGGIGARKAVLELALTEVLINGELKSIKTSILAGQGESGGLGKKVIKAAAIGALVDGNDGAQTGAEIGAGVAILGGGKHAGVMANTLIEFRLVEALAL